jgi:hypothetical protein
MSPPACSDSPRWVLPGRFRLVRFFFGRRHPYMKNLLDDSIQRIAESSERLSSIQDEAVWISIFCAVANSPETSVQTALKWADDGLKAFRSRF